MTQSFVDALFDVFEPDQVVSVFWKGSSRKPWDSPIDYVPEFSDVDIHVRFYEPPAPGGNYLSLDTGLRIQEALESGFQRRVSDPVHIPRVQYIPANVLDQEDLFVPSPAAAVETLYGREYQAGTIDEAASRASACALLEQYRPVLTDLPEQVADKPGSHLWSALRLLTWRVSPAGPRALEVLGVPYEEAWSANRTAVVDRLEELGLQDFADAYTNFYLRGWDYFQSRGDSAYGRDAVRAAATVLTEALRVAQESPEAR